MVNNMKYIKLIIIYFIILFSFTGEYNAKKEEVTLSKCVDGDTARFIYNGEEIKTRFLAIDTPESVHPTKEVMAYGKDASEYTCNLLTNATKIEIEYDEGSTKKDKYDRDLVWVFVDDKLLQEELIRVGYASVKYIYGDYYYTDRLYSVEKTAKENKYGIWNEENTENKEENKTETEVKKEENKPKGIVLTIGSLKIELNGKEPLVIILIVVVIIILALTNSKKKIKIKLKK